MTRYRRARGAGSRLAATALVGCLALAGCSAGKDAVDPEAGGQQRFVAGTGGRTDFAPADRVAPSKVAGELLDGRRLDLADLRGKVVVVNFWGSWCAPCRAEADDLEAVYGATKASGVEFVGVNVKDSRDNAEAFGRTFKITYPSYFDPTGRVALKFRKTPPNAIPATVLLDRRGRVASVFRTPLLREDLRPVVATLAAERS
jgi:thiol-disulfide isomerase/thioredoxin